MTDRRARYWVALDSKWPHGQTMQVIREEFGPEGLALYVCLITACKRGRPMGTFSWTTETDAFQQLGQFSTDQFSFTFDTFATRLGQLKKSRRTRRGGWFDIVLTDFEEWQNIPRTGAGRARAPWEKASQDGQNGRAWEEQKARLTRATSAPESAPQEREKEIEIEKGHIRAKTDPPIDVSKLLEGITGHAKPPEPRPRDEQLDELKRKAANE